MYSPSRSDSTGIRADSVAVDWLGRNLYWIDGVNSQIVAIRLKRSTVESVAHSVILDEDLDQPRALALLPQKGSVSPSSLKQTVLKSLMPSLCRPPPQQPDVLDRNW